MRGVFVRHHCAPSACDSVGRFKNPSSWWLGSQIDQTLDLSFAELLAANRRRGLRFRTPGETIRQLCTVIRHVARGRPSSRRQRRRRGPGGTPRRRRRAMFAWPKIDQILHRRRRRYRYRHQGRKVRVRAAESDRVMGDRRLDSTALDSALCHDVPRGSVI